MSVFLEYKDPHIAAGTFFELSSKQSNGYRLMTTKGKMKKIIIGLIGLVGAIGLIQAQEVDEIRSNPAMISRPNY